MLDRAALSDYLTNFVTEFADPKIAAPGQWKAYQHQTALAILESVLGRQLRLFTVIWSRQMGKTEAVAVALAAAAFFVNTLMNRHDLLGEQLRYAFPDGLQIGLFGPREDTAGVDYRRAQRILKRVVNRFGLQIRAENTQRMIVDGPGPGGEARQWWYIECMSAAPASQIESRSFNLIICEEAQDLLAEKLYNEIDPMGANSEATRVRVGTVGDQHCAFDEEIDLNKARHPENHFEHDYTVGVAANLRNGAYERYVQHEIAFHGFDSEFFKRKYRLLRNYAQGMLLTEQDFVRLARVHEKRYPLNSEGGDLPRGVQLVAGLDVARASDRTVLKIATADFRAALPPAQGFQTLPESPRVVGANLSRPLLTAEPGVPARSESSFPLSPEIILRWQKSYPQVDYDLQAAEIIGDLNGLFPEFRRCGLIAVDATGDRGDFTAKLTAAGFAVVPVVFTGGVRPTEILDGELKPGSKSSLCVDYTELISCGRFGYAADELYMGTVDFFRAIDKPLTADTVIHPPTLEYRTHKHEATHCFRDWKGQGRLDLHADPRDKNAHDDQVDADLLTVFCGLYCGPIDLTLARGTADRRVTADLISANPVAATLSAITRVFHTS